MHGLSRLLVLTAAFYASTTALVATTNATTNATTVKNMDIEYAILTITSDHALFRIELVINATNGNSSSSTSPQQLLTKFTPTKIDIQHKIATGKADPLWADSEIEQIKTVLEDAQPGFKKALDDHEKQILFSLYRPNNRTPEAIWDFTYGASVLAADRIKTEYAPPPAKPKAQSEEILAKLETLNDEMETMFRSSSSVGSPNVTEMEIKMEAFAAEGKKIYPDFARLVVVRGNMRVDEYRSALARQKKEKMAADAAKTQAPAATSTTTTTAPAATVKTLSPSTVSSATTTPRLATTTTVAMSMASVAVLYYW